MEGLQELTNALSIGTIPDPLRRLLPQDWGFAAPTQNYNRYYLRNGHGRQIWPIPSQGLSEQKRVKNVGEKSMGICRDYPIFWSTPYYLGNG